MEESIKNILVERLNDLITSVLEASGSADLSDNPAAHKSVNNIKGVIKKIKAKKSTDDDIRKAVESLDTGVDIASLTSKSEILKKSLINIIDGKESNIKKVKASKTPKTETKQESQKEEVKPTKESSGIVEKTKTKTKVPKPSKSSEKNPFKDLFGDLYSALGLGEVLSPIGDLVSATTGTFSAFKDFFGKTKSPMSALENNSSSNPLYVKDENAEKMLDNLRNTDPSKGVGEALSRYDKSDKDDESMSKSLHGIHDYFKDEDKEQARAGSKKEKGGGFLSGLLGGGGIFGFLDAFDDVLDIFDRKGKVWDKLGKIKKTGGSIFGKMGTGGKGIFSKVGGLFGGGSKAIASTPLNSGMSSMGMSFTDAAKIGGSKSGGILSKIPGIGKMGAGLGKMGGRIPLIGGLLAGGTTLAMGGSKEEAAGSGIGTTAGSVIGAALGSLLGPGIGTAIGAVIGGVIGDWVGTKLGPQIWEGLETIAEPFKDIWVDLKDSFGEIIGAFSSVWDAFKEIGSAIPEEWKSAAGGGALSILGTGIKWLANGIALVVKLFLMPLKLLIDGIGFMASNIKTTVDFVTGFISDWKEEGFIGAIKDLFGSIIDGVKNADYKNLILDAIEGMMLYLIGLVPGGKKVAEWAGYKFPTTEKKPQESITEAVKPTEEKKPGVMKRLFGGKEEKPLGDISKTMEKTGGMGDFNLGEITEKYESGGRGVGTVSSGKGDLGGVSYGKHQLSKSTVGEYMRKSKYSSEFAGLAPGSPEFTAKWKEVAARDPEGFAAEQKDYIMKTHYNPLVGKVKNDMGIDLDSRSNAVREAVFSTSVQHGGNTKLINRAFAGKDLSKITDKEILESINSERRRRDEKGNLAYFSRSSGDVQRGVDARLQRENEDHLALLEKGGRRFDVNAVANMEKEIDKNAPAQRFDSGVIAKTENEISRIEAENNSRQVAATENSSYVMEKSANNIQKGINTIKESSSDRSSVVVAGGGTPSVNIPTNIENILVSITNAGWV